MDKVQVELMQAKGKRKPLYILFNSSGEGYGLFPVDKETDNIAMLTDPVMRASTCINLYENMLSGKTIQPKELLFLALDL
jgi:aminopeptidase N